MTDIKIDISYDEFGKLQAERDRIYRLAKTYKDVIVEQEAENRRLREALMNITRIKDAIKAEVIMCEIAEKAIS